MSDELYYTDDWGGSGGAAPDIAYYGDEAWLPIELGGTPTDQLVVDGVQGYDGLNQDTLSRLVQLVAAQQPATEIPASEFGPSGALNRYLTPQDLSQLPKVGGLDLAGIAGVSSESTASPEERRQLFKSNGGDSSGALQAQRIEGTNQGIITLPNGQMAVVNMTPESTGLTDKDGEYNWAKLLQLGLGIGGLALGAKGATKANQLGQQAATQNEAVVKQAQQNYATQQARPSQYTLQGGYASLSPATTSMRRPV